MAHHTNGNHFAKLLFFLDVSKTAQNTSTVLSDKHTY